VGADDDSDLIRWLAKSNFSGAGGPKISLISLISAEET
jgi:hypothetical protein